jgi:hypothetical protein
LAPRDISRPTAKLIEDQRVGEAGSANPSSYAWYVWAFAQTVRMISTIAAKAIT